MKKNIINQETANLLHKELKHLVRLLEPLEKEGSLQVPGLATLNGARRAIAKAEEETPPRGVKAIADNSSTSSLDAGEPFRGFNLDH